MIAAMKQVGVEVARRTVRRYVIRGGVVLAVAAIGVAYRAFSERSSDSSNAESPSVATKHHVATPAASTPASAPASAPAAGTPPVAASGFAPQGIDLNGPKRAAQRAVAAENAQLAAQTGQAVPTSGQLAAPISGPGSTGAGVPASPTAGVPAAAGDSLAASRLGAPVTREMYAYEGEGRRDPFFSLILTEDLRPLLADLRLVGILYEPSGRRTVAIMRDLQTNAQYRVANGSTLGRMRVAQIRPHAVIFSIDEFGLSRQDSLVWSDTTKVRN